MAIINIQVSGSVRYDYIPVSASFQTGGGLAKYVRFFLNGSQASSLESFSSPVTSTTKYYQYTGLRENTSYSLTVHFYDSSIRSLGSSTIYVTTPSAPDTSPPSIMSWYQTSVNVNSVSMYASAYDNKGVGGFWFYLNGSSWGSASGSSAYYTFSGLQPDTTYTFGVKAYDTSGNQSSMSTISYRTLKARPSDLYWDSSKYSGGPIITASEWNRLTSKINEFRTYRGYGYYSFSYAYSGNIFYASMYNQAVSALRDMTSNVPPTHNSGDTIFASEIDRLRTGLNSIY